MISNLRARPIQGYITDSAGNVLRNSSIVIYRNDPSGLVSADRATSDDEGYFISSPLPNGLYDIYESGIRTARIIHSPDQNSIQCFKALKDNYYENDLTPFSSLVASSELMKFKYFLQIEPEEISVDIFGNTFPVYDVDLSALQSGSGDLYDLSEFLVLRSDSRITVSRFDVEYFLPITASQATYRRIKWAGIPGIRFREDSKIVVPLDYFSIVAGSPFIISNNGNDWTANTVEVLSIGDSNPDHQIITVSGDSDDTEYVRIYNRVGIGDILKLALDAPAGSDTWYGIITEKGSYNITLEKWQSSRFESTYSPTEGDDVLSIRAFHGMFQGMTAMSSTVSEYFNVVENLSQQCSGDELYNYSGRY